MRLLPREEKFYALFLSQLDIICEAAGLLLQGVKAGHTRLAEVAKEIKRLEHQGDDISHETFTRLNSTFITPLDPEDIHSLASRLDDVLDGIEDASHRMTAYHVSPIPQGMVQLCEMIDTCGRALKKAVEALDEKKEVREHCVAINRIENEANHLVLGLVFELFENEIDLITLIKIKEIYEFLAATTDHCEDVADVLQNVVVKEFNRLASRMGFTDMENYYWYHTIELPDGLVTPGLFDFRPAVEKFCFPRDMRGMRVLDVGSATGFFAFEFVKRGAQVVSVELPSLYALDRFPGQSIEQTLEKIEEMMDPKRFGETRGYVRKYTAEQLYFYLLEGPFEFCRKLLNAAVKRCYSTVYDLPEAKLGAAFDLVFMGDILLHTLHPLNALAAVAPLCRGTLVLSQVMPEETNDKPAMLYVGGDTLVSDAVCWWLPNQACLVQLLKKLGFASVTEVGRNTGLLRPSGYAYDRPILHAVK
jgi:predicted phosphate transport protein (TIGR00153 family)